MYLVNGGRQRRSYTYIEDAIDMTMRVIENRNGCCAREIFNVGNPANDISIRELANLMIALYRRRWWNGSDRLPQLIEISGEQFYGEGYDDSDRRIPDITKARTILDLEPRFGIEKSVERSMEYWCGREPPDA